MPPALAISSRLYRTDCGFWQMLSGRPGHPPDFRGAFDTIMAFFLRAEIIRCRSVHSRCQPSPAVKIFAAAILVGASAFLILGTYYFTKLYWGPAIIDRLGFQ
jgi:hypothetical protein